MKSFCTHSKAQDLQYEMRIFIKIKIFVCIKLAFKSNYRFIKAVGFRDIFIQDALNEVFLSYFSPD